MPSQLVLIDITRGANRVDQVIIPVSSKVVESNQPFAQKTIFLLSEMISIMLQETVNELPVVDDEMHVVGEVNMLEAIKQYLELRKDS